MRHFIIFSACSLFLGASPVLAQQASEPPVILEVNLEGNGSFFNLSDNGLWAVGDAPNPANGSIRSYATLVDATTGEKYPLWNKTDDTMECSARDVADNGDVAGSYMGNAAVYRREAGKWIVLPRPQGEYESVALYSITPDGLYAVGEAMTASWGILPVAYKLSDDSGELLPLPDFKESRCHRVLPGGKVPFCDGLYDLTTGQTTSVTGKMAPEYHYSPDGKWMLQNAIDEDDQHTYGPYNLVNLITGEVTQVDDNSGSSSVYADGVDNNGLLYGCSEHDLMFRTWHVHVGRYWYDIRKILDQVYGIDWNAKYAKTDEGLAGTLWCTDGSGQVIISSDYTKAPTANYIFRMPHPFTEICPDINLLDNYFVTPVDGASFSRLSNLSVQFDRPVGVVGEQTAAELVDSDGNVVRKSIAISLSPGSESVAHVSFRGTNLEDGKTYTVVIPAGTFCVSGDEQRLSGEIRVSYKGRPNTPVKPVSISPADGNEVPRINISSNPVIVNFDTDITACENPDNERRLSLYLEEEGGLQLISSLNGSITGSQLLLYPVNEVLLAEGSQYRVVVSAGTFADLSGANPNEEFSVSYRGSYTPEPPADERVIFSDDFNQGISRTKWMFHEGDGNVPTQEAASWDFTPDGTPWYFVRDDASSADWAACSHSMYSPAGQSDDWMVTQRLYIADDTYTLKFKSQSFRNGKQDILKVYAWASDDVVTALTPAIVNSMRYAGTLLYDEVQSPGSDENILAGDWRENEISLAQFAGKNIYIAFVNDNYNQSAIFMDDVEVSRDLTLSMQLFTPAYTISQDEVTVSGRLQNLSGEVVDELSLSLLDAEGNSLDKIEAKSLALAPDALYPFEFAVKLPLPQGIETYFSVVLDANGKETSVRGSVKNLAFQTTRRVVLEEMTGTTCQFCPQGHVVIEHLENEFGDRFIPIAVHSYTGGTFYSEEAFNYSQFLGLSAAPTAVIDRMYLASPLNADYEMIDTKGGRLWYDIVAERIGSYADADISIGKIEATDGKFNVKTSVKYAYDANNLNVNLFAVVMEDNLKARQQNAFVNSTAPIMADWEAGGPYGTPNAPYTYTSVMRGTYGSTFNGTGGFIPASVTAGESYEAEISFPVPVDVKEISNTKVAVVMIDANTGQVVNAACGKTNTSGVEDVAAEADVRISAEGEGVAVRGNGNVAATAYSADGRVLASASGDDEVILLLGAHRGVVIVRAECAGATRIAKLMF